MRNYGRFTTSIVRDADFQRLTAEQQGVYFMLGLQPEMSAAGTLPLTLRRWAAMSEGMTPEGMRDVLKVLEAHGHIVVDEDTEELLIVKFVKWDGGLENSKRKPVIREAACAIASMRIRHALAEVVAAIGHTDLADALSGFDRSVVTEGEYVPHSQTATQEGEPPTADVNAGPPSMFCSKHPNGTEEPCGPCGTAKLRYAAYAKDKTHREVEARKTRAAAIAACELCDEKGMRLHPDTKQPLGRCTHAALSSVTPKENRP